MTPSMGCGYMIIAGSATGSGYSRSACLAKGGHGSAPTTAGLPEPDGPVIAVIEQTCGMDLTLAEFLSDATLVAATLAMGMMAGVFALYSHTVMRGLGRTDDRTFVGAFQSIDKAIINPWFLSTFLGALVFSMLAGLLQLGSLRMPWILAALVLYLIAFVATIAVNVPLNNDLKAAGDVDRITDLAAVRGRFNEAKWARWNHVRTVTSVAATVCLAIALLNE
jgi:uncharacterized membrane protein